MASVTGLRASLLAGVLGLALAAAPASPAALEATEAQVKAVFVFNFSHFVAWPAESFTGPTEPFVIGVLGGEEIAVQLEEAVDGERMEEHPLVVRRLRSLDEARDCRIVYVGRPQGRELEQLLALLAGSPTLTVSDMEGSAQRGVMIQLAREGSRIRLLINVEAARMAGLTISSNLLRPARIVRRGR